MFLREDEIKADGAGVGESVGGGRAGSTWFFLSERLDRTLKKKKRNKKTQEQKNNGCSVAHSHIIQERGACFAAPLVKCALPQRNVPQGGIPPLRYNVQEAGHTAKTVFCLPLLGFHAIPGSTFKAFLGFWETVHGSSLWKLRCGLGQFRTKHVVSPSKVLRVSNEANAKELGVLLRKHARTHEEEKIREKQNKSFHGFKQKPEQANLVVRCNMLR